MAVLTGSGFHLTSALGAGGNAAEGTVLSAAVLGPIVDLRTNANIIGTNSIMNVGDELTVDTNDDGNLADETALKQTDNDRFINSKVTYTDGSSSNVTLELVSLSDGTQVILFAENGANLVNMAASLIRSIELGTFDTMFNNRYAQDNFSNTVTNDVVCFCDATRIQTPDGERVITDLIAGDEVSTVECGVQKVAWVGQRVLSTAQLVASPDLRPVRIPAGALGKQTPRTDLFVSPQHRILLVSKIAKRMFGQTEIFVPAIKLVGTNGIEQTTSVAPVTYFHILFETHQIVFANNAPAESLYLGPQAIYALPDDARREISKIFPEIETGKHAVAPARETVRKRAQVNQLLDRHHKNAKQLVALELVNERAV